MALAPASTSRHNAGMDLLRVLAIVLVIFRHYPTPDGPYWWMELHRYGWTGVDLFFVLSGYLIGHQLLLPISRGEKFSLANFYKRRAFRILPAYFTMVLAYFIFPILWEENTISPVWRLLSFTQNFGLNTDQAGSFTHAWSLCVEEHFYLLLPLTVLALSRARVKGQFIVAGLVTMLTTAVAARAILWMSRVAPLAAKATKVHYHVVSVAFLKEIYYPTYTHFDGLLVGVAIALIQIFRPRAWKRLSSRGDLVLLGGVGLFLFSAALSGDFHSFTTDVFAFTLFSMSFGGMVISCLSENSVLSKLKSKHVTPLAALAYAIYLTHKPVIKLSHLSMEKIGFDKFSVPTTLVTFLSILLVAHVLHRWVERPFLLLRDKVSQMQWDSGAQGWVSRVFGGASR